MLPAARRDDNHTCPRKTPRKHEGGPILAPCEATVWINSRPAARVDDHAHCNSSIDTIAEGSPTVLIGNKMQSADNGGLQNLSDLNVTTFTERTTVPTNLGNGSAASNYVYGSECADDSYKGSTPSDQPDAIPLMTWSLAESGTSSYLDEK